MEQKTMDALEAIQTRRSVRRYVTRQIDDEIVEQLLSAAMSAPSAANEQPWEFIVIKDREMLDGIPAFSPYARMTTHAPLGILVCADTRNLIAPGFWVQDCSAATQNLLILSLIHISEPTRLGMISYAVFCLKKKNKQQKALRDERTEAALAHGQTRHEPT